MKKKIVASVFSFVLAFLLSVALLAGSFSLLFHSVAFNPADMEKIAKRSDYTDQLYDQICSSWENLLAITGVSQPQPIMAVLTPEGVREDALLYLRTSYSGKGDFDGNKIEAALDQKIRDYVTGQGEEITEEVEENIQDLVSACLKKYENSIRIPLLPTLLGKVGKIRPYLVPVSVASFGFAIFLLVFIFFLQEKKKETLYYLVISLATSAFILLAMFFLAEGYEITSRLPIEKSALLTLIVAYLQNIIDQILLIGIVFAGAAGLFLVLYLLITLFSKERSLVKEAGLTEKKSDDEEN